MKEAFKVRSVGYQIRDVQYPHIREGVDQEHAPPHGLACVHSDQIPFAS
jgi:hypothetical protein